MILRLSRFIHRLPLGDGRVLVIHAVSHLRLVVDAELAQMIDFFETPRELPDDQPIAGFAGLIERGILTRESAEVEMAGVTQALAAYHGRDPAELLERFRRAAKEGPEPYWAASAALSVADLASDAPRLDVLLFGDCDIHMESDFLRREAAARGLDLKVAATFPDDLRLAGEHRHDAVLIGALRARHMIAEPLAPEAQDPPFAVFIAQARHIIESLRAVTAAPILIDNLPEPSVQPLGLAERGQYGHRNRFRLANVALAALAEAYADVHVVDVAASLAATGVDRLLDDGQVGYTHFGSPGWMLQRPESEKAAVHGLFPDPAPLARLVEGDPYGRERIMAKAHVDVLTSVIGLGRIKCVVLDLDGTLWPGVLAETGAPFAWSPEVSGPFSYIGLYFGLHEALLSLKQRGIVLACVSKNDEATVRELWTYEPQYPRDRLLTPDDFVTWRVNWNDKVENIQSIAEELGFAPEALLFIDDHPIERDRVRQRLPAVEVWGEDLFELRRRLLSDPRLQPPAVSAESAARTETTKAQLDRRRQQAEAPDENAFLASLNVQARIDRVTPGAALARIEELFQRTTQFNTTGARFPVAQLEALLAHDQGRVFTLHVSDRFGDYGLVGAAVILGGNILGLAMSCRVLGLGVEHDFMRGMLAQLAADHETLSGQIIETARNGPVRNLYRDHGFSLDADGFWRRSF